MAKWWPFQRNASTARSAVLMGAALPQRFESQTYGGYQLEIKQLPTGWQIIVTKDGAFVSNGPIKDDMATALDEARGVIDKLQADAR